MAFGRFLTTVLIFGCLIEVLASASTAPPSDSSVSCYRIEPATVAGVVSADVLLTLIIVVITYRIASSRQKRTKIAENIYMNTKAKNNKNNKRPQKLYQTVE